MYFFVLLLKRKTFSAFSSVAVGFKKYTKYK